MADYVVKFTGQDNLTSTLKNIKNELNQTGNSAGKLDQIRTKIDRINSSSAPLKRQLRDLQALMAQMNLNGLSGSEEFQIAAARAGQLKDAITDASTATKLLASDTAGLDAGIKALQGIAGAAGVATGVMGLLGVENEKTQQAMLKVQSVLSIMNGVQQVANVLNKDSVLMLKLKQVWQNANTAATTANTAATITNTGAIGASTIAQKAWNVVKAIGKALMGDWTGLLIVGAGALATYAIATNNSTDKQKNLNNSVDEGKKIFQNYTNNVATNAGNLIGKYTQLQTAWNNLKTTGEKTQWIKKNANEFSNLGLRVTDLKSAEDVFVKNTSKVVQALETRAKVMAAQAMLTEAYTQYYKDVLNADSTVAGGGYYTPAKVGDLVVGSDAKGAGLTDKNYDRYSVRTQQQADQINQYRLKKAQETNQKIKADSAKTLGKTVSAAQKIIADGAKEIQGLGITTGGGGRSTGSGGGTTTTTKTAPTPEGSLKYLREQLQQLNTKLELEVDQESAKQLVIDIEQLKQQISDKEIQIGLKPRFKDSKVKPEDLLPKLDNLDIPIPDSLKGLETSLSKLEELKEKQQHIVAIADAAREAGDAFNQLGQAIGGTAGAAIGAFGQIAATIAQTIGQVISMMIANGVSSAMALPFPANLAAAAAVMAGLASIIATIKSAASGSYADGGIVGGSSYHGDKLLARVNAGEMILNGNQQRNLFNLLNSGGGLAGGGEVEFKISGSTLKGVLRNYDNKMNKVK